MSAVHNSPEVAAALDRAGAQAQDRATRVTRHHAMLLQAKIQANASGRPGPRAPTGDYRRSWNTSHAGQVSTVGTNKPQARRLEWGFYGPDRLGRVYNQPPYPHVGPAVDWVIPRYHQALTGVIDDI